MVKFNEQKKEILLDVHSHEGSTPKETSIRLDISESNASTLMYRYTWFGWLYRRGRRRHYKYYTKKKGRKWLFWRGLIDAAG